MAPHGGGVASFIEALPGWAQALATLGAVVTVVSAGRFVAGLLLVIGFAALMTSVGLSPALLQISCGINRPATSL